MLIKLILSNLSGVIDTVYLNATPDVGGFVNSLSLPQGWLLDHGDTIKVEFLDRLKEDDETTDEDDRQLHAAKDGVLRDAIEAGKGKFKVGDKVRIKQGKLSTGPTLWEIVKVAQDGMRCLIREAGTTYSPQVSDTSLLVREA